MKTKLRCIALAVFGMSALAAQGEECRNRLVNPMEPDLAALSDIALDSSVSVAIHDSLAGSPARLK